MTLANYINDLLYRYDCVIIPNFGGFVTNTIGAQVNHYTHTFYPPTKQVTFNSHLKHNDGLLANYLVTSEQLSFEEATATIAHTVQQWQQQLQSGTVALDALGTLSLNDEQQVVFEPDTSTNYLTASFGLANVASPAIKRLTQDVKPLVPVAATNERKGFATIAKYAAAAAIALTIGVAGWNYNQQQQKEVLATQQEKAMEKKIQSATFVIDNPLPTINLNTTKATPKNFHIIAGAFEFPQNAQKKVMQLKKKGFNAAIIGKNKWGLIQVAFDSYKTRNEAVQQLRNIQQNVSEDAWLLVQQLN